MRRKIFLKLVLSRVEHETIISGFTHITNRNRNELRKKKSIYTYKRRKSVFCILYCKQNYLNKDGYLFLTDVLINIHDAGMEYFFQLDGNYSMFVFRPSRSFFLLTSNVLSELTLMVIKYE